MGLFNRKSSDSSTAPAELQDYYRSTTREHKSVAWLLAFGTFVVTLVVLLGVFFAGKLVYRKIAKKNTPAPVQTTQTTSKTGTNLTTTKPDDNKDDNLPKKTNTSGPQTSSTNTSTPSAAPSTTKKTTPPPTRLVNTGPDEDL